MGYTHAIDSLKGVLITLGTSIGAVMLVYGGIKFAMAFRQMDQQGERQAVYSVVAGGVLLGLGALGVRHNKLKIGLYQHLRVVKAVPSFECPQRIR